MTEKKNYFARVPLNQVEEDVVRDQAKEMGISIARLIRRCLFGLEYEAQCHINPGGYVKPTVRVSNGAVKVKRTSKS